MKLSRREFLIAMAPLLAGFGGMGRQRISPAGYFTWLQLKYPGAWDPNPNGAERFLSELRRRTSIEPDTKRRTADPGDREVFRNPFLYISGRGGFPELGDDAAAWFGRYIEYGGFALFDDAGGVERSPFSTGAERFIERALPGAVIEPLPADHTVYQSFYLINRIPGRKVVRPVVSGVTRDNLTPVMLFHNDLLGAFEGDPMGEYAYPCIPGGETQREMSFRMGVNIVMYALSDNYKKDQVHIPFILKRRQGR